MDQETVDALFKKASDDQQQAIEGAAVVDARQKDLDSAKLAYAQSSNVAYESRRAAHAAADKLIDTSAKTVTDDAGKEPGTA